MVFSDCLDSMGISKLPVTVPSLHNKTDATYHHHFVVIMKHDWTSKQISNTARFEILTMMLLEFSGILCRIVGNYNRNNSALLTKITTRF
jgi:hypothetical protein